MVVAAYSEDIPLLVHHFVSGFARRLNKELKHIPSEVMEVLRLHDWRPRLASTIGRATSVSCKTSSNAP
jgi:DNA-binding NtrC family response regulator